MNTTKFSSIWPALAAALAGALLVGCSALSGPTAEPPRRFAFSPEIGAGREEASSTMTVFVSPLVSTAALESTDMVYVPRRYEIDAFANSEWAAPPGRLIEPWVVEALERGRVFAHVVTGGGPRDADLALHLSLQVLQQEFDGEASRARLVLRATLTSLREDKVVAVQTIEQVETTESPDPYSGVKALNRALTRVLEDLVRFCRRAVSG